MAPFFQVLQTSAEKHEKRQSTVQFKEERSSIPCPVRLSRSLVPGPGFRRFMLRGFKILGSLLEGPASRISNSRIEKLVDSFPSVSCN